MVTPTGALFSFCESRNDFCTTMATVDRSTRPCCDSSFLHRRNIMSFRSFFMFMLLLFTIDRCFSEDDHEMEEFLKREYSLSKPYQGTRSVQEQCCMLGYRCFQKDASGGLNTSVLFFLNRIKLSCHF